MQYSFKVSGGLLLLLFLCQNSIAQFTLSGQIKPRLEFNHGYKDLLSTDLKPSVVFSQRSRLVFDYTHKIFETKLSVQDVRIWGDLAQLSSSDVTGISLHEAWGKIKFKEFYYFKFGRQELVYNDQRLLGNVDWAQQARSHDAALFGFEKEDFKLHIAGAYNNDSYYLNRNSYSIDSYRVLSFLWLNKIFDSKIDFSFIAIANGVEQNEDSTLYFTGTFGTHLEYEKNKLKSALSLYYQLGKTNSITKTNALLAAFSLTYNVKKTTLKVGADFLSGTNNLDAENSKLKTFNTLYATNHKFYGFMDYFINIPTNTSNGGLIDFYAGVNSNIGEKSKVLFNTHYFLLANKVNNPVNVGTALNKGLGVELDAVYNLKIHEMVSFSAGWSVLLPTYSLDVIDNGSRGKFNTWAWTSFTFEPTFFKSKENEKE